MLEFQEKRKFRKLVYCRTTLIILIVLIVLLLNGVWKVYKKQAIAKENLAKTATVYDGLRAQEEKLLGEIERLETVVGKEEEIRAKYGLVKPNEEVIVVVDKTENKNTGPASTPISVWQKVLDWLR